MIKWRTSKSVFEVDKVEIDDETQSMIHINGEWKYKHGYANEYWNTEEDAYRYMLNYVQHKLSKAQYEFLTLKNHLVRLKAENKRIY